jgi:hypothetical protein
MAKRKRKASARKKTATKRGKGKVRGVAARKKATKRAGGKTVAKKTAKRAAVKAKSKKSATRKKVAPPAMEAPQQPPAVSEETVIIDIVEEPAPGVLVVTEFEAVQSTKPPEHDGGSD